MSFIQGTIWVILIISPKSVTLERNPETRIETTVTKGV